LTGTAKTRLVAWDMGKFPIVLTGLTAGQAEDFDLFTS
jgi:hypothetical protein